MKGDPGRREHVMALDELIEVALMRACATGQRIGESVCPGTLFSEDLW